MPKRLDARDMIKNIAWTGHLTEAEKLHLDVRNVVDLILNNLHRPEFLATILERHSNVVASSIKHP